MAFIENKILYKEEKGIMRESYTKLVRDLSS